MGRDPIRSCTKNRNGTVEERSGHTAKSRFAGVAHVRGKRMAEK